MKKDDIAIGEPHAVEHPRDEASMGYGHGHPVVKATPLEVGVARGGSSRKDGVRCRLDEPLRVLSSDPGGWGEVPVGTEFVAPAAGVLKLWGTSPSRVSGGAFITDDERVALRRRRYEEQDFLRERLTQLGLPVADEGYHGAAGPVVLKAGQVLIERSAFVAWLERVDPATVAAEAIDAFIEAVERHEPWTGLRDLRERKDSIGADERYGELAARRREALIEVADGLAVSDADIEPDDTGAGMSPRPVERDTRGGPRS